MIREITKVAKKINTEDALKYNKKKRRFREMRNEQADIFDKEIQKNFYLIIKKQFWIKYLFRNQQRKCIFLDNLVIYR